MRRDDLWSWFYMLVELLQGKLLWRENRAPGKRASGSDDEAKKTAHRMKLRALSDPNALFSSGRCPGQCAYGAVQHLPNMCNPVSKSMTVAPPKVPRRASAVIGRGLS